MHRALPAPAWAYCVGEGKLWRQEPSDVVRWDTSQVTDGYWWDVMSRGVFRYAVGPVIGRDGAPWHVWAELYARSHSYTTDGAVVQWGGDPDELAQVPSRYPVMIATGGDWHGFELEGRSVWLSEGAFAQQWLRYCELRACGVKVKAILLKDIASPVRYKVLGGDLMWHFLDDSTKAERFLATAKVLQGWWGAVGRLYD